MLKYLIQTRRILGMNKEFIILSDSNIAVTDESGHISKREYNNNPQEILLTENKIEIIDNKLEQLKKDLHYQKYITFWTKQMLKLQPILLLLISSGMFIYGGVTSPNDFLTYAIFNGTRGLVYGTAICGIASIYYGITKTIYKKKVNKTTSEIAISKKAKDNYEKKLLDIKEKNLAITSPSISMNEPVSLIEQTNIIEQQINEEINKTYTESLNQQQKKLVLRKK